jgi:pseudouridine kinase
LNPCASGSSYEPIIRFLSGSEVMTMSCAKSGRILVIGGATIDLQGRSAQKLVWHDSNPGLVQQSWGGVGRNIADNLARLGAKTQLLTAVGGDERGKDLVRSLQDLTIDTEAVLTVPDKGSATYFSIFDEKGGLVAAIADMEVFHSLTPDYILQHRRLIEEAEITVLDANLPEETLTLLLTRFADQTTYFVDPVSTHKALRLTGLLSGCHTFKPNQYEAEALSGIALDDADNLPGAAAFFRSKGVKRILISLAERGVYYADETTEGLISAPSCPIVSVSGAGDAFFAGVCFSHLMGYSLEKSVRFGRAASALALQHAATITPAMSLENIERVLGGSL